MSRRKADRDSVTAAERHRAAISDAWTIHAAQLDWTAKADAKAAFAFAIDSAIIATVGVLMSTNRVFVHFDRWYLIDTFVLAAVLLAAAIVLASIGVAPSLVRRSSIAAWPEGFIYFGHARHWNPVTLAAALEEKDILPQLSRQIVVTAEIAWRKHRYVGWSIWLTLVAGGMLVLYAILTRF